MHTMMTKGAASAKTAAPERLTQPIAAINTPSTAKGQSESLPRGRESDRQSERLSGATKGKELQLNAFERADLVLCERKIEKGLATFWEVGTAIAQIRAARLYRETHATFEDYLQHKWGLGGRRARQLCAAAGVNDSLNDGTIDIKLLPNTESQARVLAGVPVEQRKEVYADLLKIPREGPPTAREISEALKGDKEREDAETRRRGERESVRARNREAEKIGKLNADDFRIARSIGKDLWHIKQAPGWRVATVVKTLSEAITWLADYCRDPMLVQVTDSGTWQNLGYWAARGTEPMADSPEDVKLKQAKAADASLRESRRKADAQRIVDAADDAVTAVRNLRGLLLGNEERLRAGLNVAISRVEEVEKKFRRKVRQ